MRFLAMDQPTRWHRVVPKALFAYGCLTTLVGVCFHGLIAQGWRLPERYLEEDAIWFATALGLHFGALVIANPRKPSLSPWVPVLLPTKQAVRTARIVVIAAFCNVGYWFVSPLWFRPVNGEGALLQMLVALFVLMGCWPAVYWAVRPEHFFSPRVLAAYRWHPLWDGIVRPLMKKRYAKRHAIPLDKWLAGVLECCETAARAGRLVNSGSPELSEVDCGTFQSYLMTELEARACLQHYREDLSREAFREMRQFIYSVDALDDGLPDQEEWQQVVRDARAVLALRNKLRAGR